MNKEIKKPNFFIIGAPKCGTTSLSRYLGEHDDICFSDPKEPNFFNTDFPDEQRKFDNIENYISSCFSGIENCKAAGEGTVWYLYSKEAVSNILEFNPNAKIILMVRNPIDMFFSLYQQNKVNLDEDADSAEEAWALQSLRKEGKNIPESCNNYKMLIYSEVCALGEQVERVYELVPEQQRLTIFLEDLKEDSLFVYKEVLDFLNINYKGRTSFPVHKKRKNFRHKIYKDIIFFIRKIKKTAGINGGFGLLNKFKDLSLKTRKQKTNNDEFSAKLINHFSPSIKQLEEVTGRNLSHWLK